MKKHLASSRRTRRAAAAASRGFTLVELMISLVMGLIVALAAVALAKSSTTAFHEQARMSGVEMTLRSASERLRADLMKTSYMSTPNIHLDPRIARTPGPLPWPAYRIPALQNLQGIRIAVGGSKATTEGPGALATANGLNPDSLFLSGNFASDDMYRGQWRAESTVAAGKGPQIRLSARADPAVGRLFNGATDIVKAAQAVFMPGEVLVPPAMTPLAPGLTYVVQITDMRGCLHFLPLMSITLGNEPESVFLEINGDGAAGILTPDDTKDTCGGRLMEEVSIAPVMRVNWYVSAIDELVAAAVPDNRLYDPGIEPGGVHKFNLYRQVLDATGVLPVGPAELIAEYAIDLKVGLVVDDLQLVPGQHTVRFFDMEGAGTDITAWTANASSTLAGQAGPQRVRSVRYRMAFRAPYFDREADLPMPGGPPYLARYCITPASPCRQFSRVRTVMSEVNLFNQQRVFF